MEVLVEGRELSPEQSLMLARAMTEILAEMEESRLAHCDLSGPNVLLPSLIDDGNTLAGTDYPMELVDVEQMYGPGLERPDFVPGGSPGYAAHRVHRNAAHGIWEPKADRFAGAVLVAEMLCWCDERIRDAAWGESFFEPCEMQQQDSHRYALLASVLQQRWGSDAAGLLERAWRSDSLDECPNFGRWLVALPDRVSSPSHADSSEPETVLRITAAPTTVATEDRAKQLMLEAGRLEDEGDLAGALAAYREARSLMPPDSSLAAELALIISYLEIGQRIGAEPKSSDESALAELFDDALVAFRQGEWSRAKELLDEVVRQQPDYERGGKRAPGLLATAEKQLARGSEPRPQRISPGPSPDAVSRRDRDDLEGARPGSDGLSAQLIRRRVFSPVLLPIALVALLLIFGGIAVLLLQGQSKPNQPAQANAATSVPKAATVDQPVLQPDLASRATNTAQAREQAAATAHAEASSTAQHLAQSAARLQEQETAQAVSQQATLAAATAQAQSTERALLVAEVTAQAQASAKAQAEAQSQQATQAVVQAQQSATARVIQEALDRANAQSTAQAQQAAQTAKVVSEAATQAAKARADAIATIDRATAQAQSDIQRATAQARAALTQEAVARAAEAAQTQAARAAQAHLTSEAQAQNQKATAEAISRTVTAQARAVQAQQATIQAQQAATSQAQAQATTNARQAAAQAATTEAARAATARAAPTSTPLMAVGSCGALPNKDGRAVPHDIKAGQALELEFWGFTSGERFTFRWMKPDGEAYTEAAEHTKAFDANGTLTILYTVPQGWTPGRWSLEALGKSSGHLSVIYFCVIR
jgi:hypothetical protein